METQLGMTSILYCYGESEPIDDEDECHIDRVVVDEDDGDAKVVEPVNQYMTPFAPEFEVVSVDH